MEELKHYNSFEELKDHSESINPASAKSMERHDRFEEFISLLRNAHVSDTPSTENNKAVDKHTVYAV
ncbi:hypothetical protein GCM10028808_01180 [Spirosoma migulaei]